MRVMSPNDRVGRVQNLPVGDLQGRLTRACRNIACMNRENCMATAFALFGDYPGRIERRRHLGEHGAALAWAVQPPVPHSPKGADPDCRVPAVVSLHFDESLLLRARRKDFFVTGKNITERR